MNLYWLTKKFTKSYGLVVNDYVIVGPSLVGLTSGLTCTYIMDSNIQIASKQRRQFNQALAICGIYVLSGLLLLTVNEFDKASSQIGTMAAFLSVLFAVSPLTGLKHVYEERNMDPMPLTTAGMVFINGSMWVGYGLFVRHDPRLWIPNSIGASVALFQLILHLLFHLGVFAKFAWNDFNPSFFASTCHTTSAVSSHMIYYLYYKNNTFLRI